MEYNIRSFFIRLQILKSVKVVTHLFAQVTISEILTFQVFTLKGRSRSQSTIFAMLLFDGEQKILQKLFDSVLR